MLLVFALSAAACSPEPRRAFRVGILGPVSSRIAVEAGRLGLEISDQAPQGSAFVPAATPLKNGEGEVTASWTKLRFFTARAIARGSGGIVFSLPRTAADHDLIDYPEEWQAVTRICRELRLMKPILQSGAPSQVPLTVPSGIESRAWAFHGRQYVLLVNSSDSLQVLDESNLAPWRALFSVRSDPRQLLSPCGTARCLEPEGVLWLEGRLLPQFLP